MCSAGGRRDDCEAVSASFERRYMWISQNGVAFVPLRSVSDLMLLDLGLPGRRRFGCLFRWRSRLRVWACWAKASTKWKRCRTTCSVRRYCIVAPGFQTPKLCPEGDGDTRILVQMPQQEDPVVSLLRIWRTSALLQADGDDDYSNT